MQKYKDFAKLPKIFIFFLRCALSISFWLLLLFLFLDRLWALLSSYRGWLHLVKSLAKYTVAEGLGDEGVGVYRLHTIK